jgi:hypothetical protein
MKVEQRYPGSQEQIMKDLNHNKDVKYLDCISRIRWNHRQIE